MIQKNAQGVEEMYIGLENWIIYLAALAVTLALLRADGVSLRPAREGLARQLLWGIGLASAMLVIVGAAWIWKSGELNLISWLFLPGKQRAAFVLFQLLVAVVEEGLFRVWLVRRLEGALRGYAPAALVSALLFALGHLIWNGVWFQFFVTFGIGAAFSLALRKGKRCTALSLILAHFLYDLAIVGVAGIWTP